MLERGKKQKFVVCLPLTGEALTQSSLLEADGENGDSMVTMTTTVEPMNLHHAMLRSPGRRLHIYGRRKYNAFRVDKITKTLFDGPAFLCLPGF